jgi:TrmH family RNA methyltransferase
MISKAKIKYINSLELKKNRKTDNVFVAEGPKVVGDLLAVTKANMIVATKEWMELNTTDNTETEMIEATEEELRKVSFLQHPQSVLAIFPQFSHDMGLDGIRERLSLALDGIQDPGNLGTIIRIADWFGIEYIYCSMDTADVYNPKVVQATMGSIARVKVVYTDLSSLIDTVTPDTPVYATLLDGKNIYQQELTESGIIVMGNEGNGISLPIREKINRKLFIPNFPEGRDTAESLNVAIATAITCNEFRRQKNRINIINN